MIKRARDRRLVEINLVDLRQFGLGKSNQVDDRIYGGGSGMVLMAEPVIKAIRSVKTDKSHVIYLSPQGKPLTAKRCKELATTKKHILLLCGHYEGVDERVIYNKVDEEISIGDYILTSGAPAASVIVDAISRLVPGVIDNDEATREESFEDDFLGFPVYTRPPTYEGQEVPRVLLSGNHAEIKAWREEKAKEKTKRVRPDLYKGDKK